MGVFWRVVSVGSDHLSLLLSEGHLYSNPLGLAVHDTFRVVLVPRLCHGNPLGLGMLGLGGSDLGDSGALLSVLLPQQLLGLVPGPAQ